MTSYDKVAVVTGANKGVGLAIGISHGHTQTRDANFAEA